MSNTRIKRAHQPRKRSAKRPATGNSQLTAQTRKQLGKHYASKYRTR